MPGLGLGRALLARQRLDEAAQSFGRADAFWRSFDPDNPTGAEAAEWLARVDRRLGRRRDAAEAEARGRRLRDPPRSAPVPWTADAHPRPALKDRAVLPKRARLSRVRIPSRSCPDSPRDSGSSPAWKLERPSTVRVDGFLPARCWSSPRCAPVRGPRRPETRHLASPRSLRTWRKSGSSCVRTAPLSTGGPGRSGGSAPRHGPR